MSNKTSTSALFDKHKRFHSFGYEAEDKYADLTLDNEAEDWYFFQRFKMTLFDKLVRLSSILRRFVMFKEYGYKFYIQLLISYILNNLRRDPLETQHPKFENS